MHAVASVVVDLAALHIFSLHISHLQKSMHAFMVDEIDLTTLHVITAITHDDALCISKQAS